MNGSDGGGGGGDMADYVMENEETSSGLLDTASTVVYRAILPVVCAFGVAGIILTLIVLSRSLVT